VKLKSYAAMINGLAENKMYILRISENRSSPEL